MSKGTKRRVPDPTGLDPQAWLTWFLTNHSISILVRAGLWKRTCWIVDDLQDIADTLQAAYVVGGEAAVWPSLLEGLRRVHGATTPPAVEDVWDHTTPTLWGKWTRDK